MTRVTKTSLAVILGLLVAPPCLEAQASSIEQFLNHVANTPVRDSTESTQIGEEGDLLSKAPRSEVEKVLPTLLGYTSNTSANPHARQIAALFLLGVAMRGDAADLLSSHSAQMAQLLTDSDPVIQRVTLTILPWLIGPNGGQNGKVYVPALLTAVRNPVSPQDNAAQTAFLLLYLGPGDPDVVAAVHAFLTRNDLNSDAKIQTLRTLTVMLNLPDQISQDLCSRFNDSDPHVRVAAIIAYSDAALQRKSATTYLSGTDPIPSEDPVAAAVRRKVFSEILNSKSTFFNEAQKRVEQIAANENENPKLRQLAKDALAGRTALDPNVLDPNYVQQVKPADPQ